MKNPQEILRKYWGYENFKASQKPIIDAVLSGKDVLALLPTGGGKSLCYQIPAMANEGLCIVVSPLIALIQNQVQQLKALGIKSIALTGGISKEELNNLLDNCVYGNYKFLYLSPERLQQEIVKDRIAQMQVSLLAIDEAHCISEWGNDFRPAYLNCALLRDIKPEAPLIALTATATAKVAHDITENLQFREHQIFKDSFNRENIYFGVIWEENKQKRLIELCENSDKSVIVYVRSRRMTQVLTAYLNKKNVSATFYHGGIPKEEKEKKLNSWLNNEVRIMVATNAFGMGIDKADVSLVVHYQIPESLENYYQEAGRAGRNGLPAKAILITNKEDEIQLKNQFLKVLPDISFLKQLYNKLNNYFQIPYGTLPEETYPFRFEEFCDLYQLNSPMAYNGLRILDQNSVISLSQNFSRKTTVQFLVSKNHLLDYLERHQRLAPLVQTILRTYGGIFDFETKINTLLISKKASIQEEKIINALAQLDKDEIIRLKASSRDLELVFLVPREDNLTINYFSKKVEAQLQTKSDKVDSMLAYIKNAKLCRNRQLLSYFGEKSYQNCNNCDVCNSPTELDMNNFRAIKNEIIELLQQKESNSRTIIKELQQNEFLVLKVLQKLLEEGNISINSKNEYNLQR
ncbi:MAG: RecQ family ATP-dependent DNA helicase [Eudoraea sp.]|nr:RecQ family ATP-dependent DNA helicase [Eudoraea sp.]